jgi:putative protein-disulfide isomerase
MEGTILYIMDPLCGWCYGFSGVMQELQEQYKERYSFSVIPGGMITGARVAPVSEMANYILGAYKRVEDYAGVTFGEPYLDILRAGTEISNSEPPCRAIHVFKQFLPERTLDYAHALQLKIFREGRSWNASETYEALAREFDIDAAAFIAAMNSDEAKYETQQEFQWVQAAGITGFPCTVLEKDAKYYMLAQGYKPLEAVKEVIERVEASEAK